MKPTWVMTKPYSGEVNDAFVKAVKRAFPGLMVDGGSTGEVLVLADFFDDPRWNGGPEYDVYFRRLGPDRWSITVPATNGGKLKAFLARELRVVPQEGFQAKEAGILDKLFKRYRKDHPNSKAPPQSLRDEAAELEKAEKEKAEKEKAEKEKAEKEKAEKEKKEKAEKEKKDKAEKDKKEKAEKEKAEKEKAEKKDKEVSDLSDEDLDKQLEEHEGKGKERLQRDQAHRKQQDEYDAQIGWLQGGGGRGYYVERRRSDEERDDAEHHERLKKEKNKRTKKNTPEKDEPKPNHRYIPQYEGDEGGGVPSWVRGASLSVEDRNILVRLASTMETGSKERRAILTSLARQAAVLGSWKNNE